MIYLDHNATTPIHPRAFEAMTPFLKECWANPSSPHRFGQQARAALERARQRIADHVECRPAELVFCSSGTESDNLALRGVAQARRSKGRHIITSQIEHHAVHHTCKSLERQGFEVSFVPVSADGLVDLAALAASLRKDTILVSVMHANNETGVIQPIAEIADLLRGRDVVLHTDAVQSFAKLPGRLSDTGADLVSISGHKIYGPKGAAALFRREGTALAPVTTGGAQEFGLRAGTENVAAMVGFAEAVALAFDDAIGEAQRLGTLRDRLEAGVQAAVDGVKINGQGARRTPNTSSMAFQDVDGESIVLGLDMQGICVSTGSACSTGEAEPSHVLRAMGLSAREAQGSIRLSLGRSTRAEDVDRTVRALTQTVKRLRHISSIGSVTG